MRASEPKPIGAALTSLLEELGLGQRIRQLKVLEVWSRVVGERIAGVAMAEHIDRGRLIVRVSKAPWRTELLFMKRQIIERLNSALGEQIVKDIIFR